jgi:hypothetical protein
MLFAFWKQTDCQFENVENIFARANVRANVIHTDVHGSNSFPSSAPGKAFSAQAIDATQFLAIQQI